MQKRAPAHPGGGGGLAMKEIAVTADEVEWAIRELNLRPEDWPKLVKVIERWWGVKLRRCSRTASVHQSTNRAA
jgi:hypothetical protein